MCVCVGVCESLCVCVCVSAVCVCVCAYLLFIIIVEHHSTIIIMTLYMQSVDVYTHRYDYQCIILIIFIVCTGIYFIQSTRDNEHEARHAGNIILFWK